MPYNATNINDCSSLIKQTLSQGCDLFIPRIKIPSICSPLWFTAHMLNKIHTSKRKNRRNPTPVNKAKLLSMELTLQNMVASSKERYIAGLVSLFASDQKKLYRYLRNLNKPSSDNSFIDTNSKVLRDPQTIADCFNKFFHQLPTPSNQLS